MASRGASRLLRCEGRVCVCVLQTLMRKPSVSLHARAAFLCSAALCLHAASQPAAKVAGTGTCLFCAECGRRGAGS